MSEASIPKKPLAVSRAKKKLPVELDWGPGIPKDRLRYINAKEEALVKRFRKTKAARDYAGIPAYPDPGDTAAGEKGKTGTTTGKTTGSGSTNGGTGQGGQSKGPGGAGQGPNSSSSTSKTASSGASRASSTASSGASRASSASKSPSSSPSSTAGGSKAPNAAAQAASDKLNGKTSGSTPPKTNAAASVSPSKAPNMAAAYASQKLNATSGALKTASQPKSIQSMINAGQIAPNGSYYGPKGGTQLNAAARTAANRSAQTAPNGSYYGPKGAGALNADARFAAARSVGFNPDPIKRTPGDAEMLGRMMMAESGIIRNQYGKPNTFGLQGVADVVRNRVLSARFPNTVPEVLMQKPKGGAWQFSPMKPDAGGSLFARTPPNEMATRIAESVLSGESPSVVGTSLNYGNLSTINNKPNYSSSKSKQAFNSMPAEYTIADARRPGISHTFGTQGKPSDVSFNGTGNSLGSVGLAAAAPKKELDLASQPLKSIPEPNSTGIPASLRSGASPSAAPMVAGDPRVSMAPGSYPPAQEMGSPPGYFSQFGMTPQDMETLKQQAMKDFSFGQLMEMRKNMDALPGFMGPITKDQQRVAQATAAPPSPQAPVPNMRPPSQNMQTPAGWGNERVLSVENYIDPTGIRDPQAATMSAPQPQSPLPASIPGFSPPGLPGNFRGTAGQAYTYSSPSTFSAENYSPEVGPGDAVPEDDPTYSESPVQGSENPMQEEAAVEEPAVKQERQKKYATRGATIGSVIAGPLGALLGGTLGWQMGKTTPGQRRSIANSPQALNANAQSINQLAEERGGKNDPNMRVRPEGLKVVLTNPKLVLDKPEAFTDLEQMLAALAAGIDPETGKPLS